MQMACQCKLLDFGGSVVECEFQSWMSVSDLGFGLGICAEIVMGK
jgi:hypothetical protein